MSSNDNRTLSVQRGADVMASVTSKSVYPGHFSPSRVSATEAVLGLPLWTLSHSLATADTVVALWLHIPASM